MSFLEQNESAIFECCSQNIGVIYFGGKDISLSIKVDPISDLTVCSLTFICMKKVELTGCRNDRVPKQLDTYVTNFK